MRSDLSPHAGRGESEVAFQFDTNLLIQLRALVR